MLSGFRVPALHHHPFPVVVPDTATFAVQPDRRQRGDRHILLTQYALTFERFPDEPVQYALFTAPADLRHAFLPFAYAGGKLLRQAAVTRALFRLTDDVRSRLLSALPAIRIDSALFQYCQRAAGTAALPTVGEQDLNVMTHGAIQHGQRFLQAHLLRLVNDKCPARDEGGSVLQGRFPGHRFPCQPRIRRQKLPRSVVSRNDVHISPLLPGHQG
ncbi:Uncharacterised protein [Raoultella planticola]|uniref:Uncharacterized protein n=1 Tax=Raoultella planticola TaxID=575 RepID=A0A8G2A334_RAOPL|nr:Uncharacterised protein [Raoultella planticola]